MGVFVGRGSCRVIVNGNEGAPQSSFVHVAAVRDPRHIDSSRGIVDGIDDPVIANPDSPTVFIAVKLFASRRSRVIGEFTYSWPDAFDDIRRQITKFPFRGRGRGYFVQRHLILPSERSSASTSSRLKRGSPARASEMMPSSISS